ncbi:MAG TPA: hypothetical protein VGI30_08345 [Caulobacteraceae bacterium]|jgi:hypothetical protein
MTSHLRSGADWDLARQLIGLTAQVLDKASTQIEAAKATLCG